MGTYILRRLLIGMFTLFLITLIVYGLIRNMPGTPVTQMELADPTRALSPEDQEMLNRIYGLDKPWHIAYFTWLGNTLQGNFGDSFSEKAPVSAVIKRRIGPTLLLSVTSLFLTYSLAIPMGLFSVVRKGRPEEQILSITLYVLYSIPRFVAGIGLLIIFYQHLGWLPPGLHSSNYETLSHWGKFLDTAKHMLLPVICCTYASLAYMSRFVKANMEEVIRQDYIRTARAKGVSPRKIVFNHAFRNTLIPFVTLLGLSLPGLLGGSIIIEQIFNWPGMGQAFFQSIANRDYPVIMGMVLLFSSLTLLGQLIADLLYAVVDPRVTLR